MICIAIFFRFYSRIDLYETRACILMTNKIHKLGEIKCVLRMCSK